MTDRNSYVLMFSSSKLTSEYSDELLLRKPLPTECNENAALINPHREQTQVQIQVVNEQVGPYLTGQWRR